MLSIGIGARLSQDEAYVVTTRRLTGGPIGAALAAGEQRGPELAKALISTLDGGEGWASTDGQRWSLWYPSRLAVHIGSFGEPGRPAILQALIPTVSGATLTDELLRWLSDLNTHAAGWWWWFDEANGIVYCSVTCLVEPEAWWWPVVLFDMLPHASTVAESMADVLAQASRGEVAQQPHPERGVRPQVDGWITGVRLGARDPAASLDLMLFDVELDRMNKSLGSTCGSRQHDLWRPLHAQVADEANQVNAVLRRHWHPHYGWGWQVAAVTGLVAASNEEVTALRELAVKLNAEQAQQALNRFGGWSYVTDLGLVHLTFVPAFVLDSIVAASGPTAGDVAALLFDGPIRLADANEALDALGGRLTPSVVSDELLSELANVGFKSGPIGWCYVDPQGQPATTAGPPEDDAVWAADSSQPLWTVPRHFMLCSFGIFNPMGPTVSSLEAAMLPSADGGVRYSLYWVMRHPHSPEIHLLGDGLAEDQLAQRVVDALSEHEQGICGAGPEWLDVVAMPEAVLAGIRQLAAHRDKHQLRREADELIECALFPWSRVSDEVTVTESRWAEGADAVDCWVEAITDPVVLAGHQLYLRSAWEGAKTYRESNWDAEAAQRATDFCRRAAEERLDAEIS